MGIEHEEATASDREKKTCQRYKHEYTELCYCLKPSTKGDTYVQTYFSCAHGGRFDCKRHIETKGHKDFDNLKQITNP